MYRESKERTREEVPLCDKWNGEGGRRCLPFYCCVVMVKERQHWPIRWQKGTTVARQQQSINSQDFVILTIPEQQKKLDFKESACLPL